MTVGRPANRKSGSSASRALRSSIRPCAAASTASSNVGSHSPSTDDQVANPWSRATSKRACPRESIPTDPSSSSAPDQFLSRTAAESSPAAWASTNASANWESWSRITGPASRPLRSQSALTARTEGATYKAASPTTKVCHPGGPAAADLPPIWQTCSDAGTRISSAPSTHALCAASAPSVAGAQLAVDAELRRARDPRQAGQATTGRVKRTDAEAGPVVRAIATWQSDRQALVRHRHRPTRPPSPRRSSALKAGAG